MRCVIEKCCNKAVLIVGDCKYCGGQYCLIHRLPESHHCTGLETCRKVHFERNCDKIMSEKITPPIVR
uniref:AN1-type domain-containing protein n=1 Tax=viral metagenome TaxID=1070528 RepID=A0A6C0BM23_9ZZZZ